MTNRKHNWEVLRGGALRFRGKAAIEDVLSLIEGDPDYTWTTPSEPLWVDVYPWTVQGRELLLDLIGADPTRQNENSSRGEP